jgi:hypothetical protein
MSKSYRLQRLKKMQCLQDLEDFLRLLESDSQDTDSPFRKQVSIAVKCAGQVNAHFAQEPLEPWVTIAEQWPSGKPPPNWLLWNTLGLVLVLGSCAAFLFLLGLLISGPVRAIPIVLGALFCIPSLFFALSPCSSIHLKLACAMSCRSREQGRSQPLNVVLTEGQAIRHLIRELQLLRVEILKRRAPLRVALLGERRGDWDFEMEDEQENYGMDEDISIASSESRS